MTESTPLTFAVTCFRRLCDTQSHTCALSGSLDSMTTQTSHRVLALPLGSWSSCLPVQFSYISFKTFLGTQSFICHIGNFYYVSLNSHNSIHSFSVTSYYGATASFLEHSMETVPGEKNSRTGPWIPLAMASLSTKKSKFSCLVGRQKKNQCNIMTMRVVGIWSRGSTIQ